MKKVFLRFYDLKNLGDDLFLEIVTSRYANPFTIVSKFPRALFDKPNLTTYHKKRWMLLSRFIEKYIYPKNFLLHKLVNQNDLYVYVGGSIFIDNGDIKHWRNERSFYTQLKKPYYILGPNFGPSRSSQYTQLVKGMLSKAQDVCFRDKASYDLFRDLDNVRFSTDIAFTLDTRPFITKAEKLAVFSIIDCANRFDAVTANRYEQEIINMSVKLSMAGYRVVYMSFCELEGDEEAIRRIKSKMSPKIAKKVEVYLYEGNLGEALQLLAKSEIIVGGRFHASVLGLLFSKKVLPMAYSNKTINLLNDLGFKGAIVDIRKINEFDGKAFDFDTIHVQDVTQQVVRAENQFRELDKVLVRKNK